MASNNDFNQQVIAEFRANDGKVGGPFAGSPMLLLTTTGAKSGQSRTTPLVYSTDGDRIVIIASKAGGPTNPDWYHNLVAHPTATVEMGTEKFQARAAVQPSGGADARFRRVSEEDHPADPGRRPRTGRLRLLHG